MLLSNKFLSTTNLTCVDVLQVELLYGIYYLALGDEFWYFRPANQLLAFWLYYLICSLMGSYFHVWTQFSSIFGQGFHFVRFSFRFDSHLWAFCFSQETVVEKEKNSKCLSFGKCSLIFKRSLKINITLHWQWCVLQMMLSGTQESFGSLNWRALMPMVDTVVFARNCKLSLHKVNLLYI